MAADSAREQARSAVESLAVAAPALAPAWESGRLFSEHGPALLAAFDEWRRRCGPGADPATFREALRERWGIDLGAREVETAG
jgi:hypothetical protein